MSDGYFTPADQAIFIAATTVANAESYLAGRSDSATLYANTLKLGCDLDALEPQGGPPAKDFVDHIRLLLTAMGAAAATKDTARLDRWCEIMTALAKLVRIEVISLRESGVIGA